MLVVQISDIHASPDSPSLLTFERAIDWLKAFRPDALVLTGDLVDDGWEQGYRRIAESLHALDFPTYLLPGNGVDVTVAGQSHGDIQPHLSWLKSTLADVATPFLLFMHQPPFGIGIDVLDQVGCRNDDALLEFLNAGRSPPLGILCGHVHRPVSSRVGLIALQTCGSLCPPNPLLLGDRADLAVLDASSFLLHEVRSGRLLSHVVSMQTLART